jgi:hypothetical protein
MSDDWAFYLCRVDGEPASIFLDLRIKRESSSTERPYLSFIHLTMRSPRPDGLSSDEEFDALVHLEDVVTAALTADGTSVYVGRATFDGCRDLFFYSAAPDDWERRCSDAFGDFPDYTFETGSRHDPEWSTYDDFLYPSPEQKQRIDNRAVCDALRKSGDALTQTRRIDHWAYFPDVKTRARFVETVTDLGFVHLELEPEPRDCGRFAIQFFRDDLPSYDGIDDVTLPLFRAALDCDGEYDGWETQVVE